MSKGMSLAAGGLVLAAVVAGAFLLVDRDGSEDNSSGATVTSSSRTDDLPSFAHDAVPVTDESRPLDAAPLPTSPSAASAEAAPKAAPKLTGPRVALSGRVVDESGRPVFEAKVSFVSDPFRSTIGAGLMGDRQPVEPAPHVLTGRDGKFEVKGALPLSGGEAGIPFAAASPTLVVQHDAFATLVHPLERLAAPGADAGDLQLAAGTWLTGRVVDESARPLAGARVRARAGGEGRGRPGGILSFVGSLAESLDEAVTGADGRFRVAGVPAGKAHLTARADGRRLMEVNDIDLQPRQPHDVGDIALPLGESIAGVVLDDDGHAVEGADVSVSSMARLVLNRIEDLPRAQIGQEFGQRAKTDATGRFEISGLGGGQYTVHVSKAGFDRLSREDVQAGTRDLRLLPVRLGGLFVQVDSERDKQAVAGARLKATPMSEERAWGRPDEQPLPVLTGQAALDAAGRSGDPAGAYFVMHAGLRGTKLVVAADGFATRELEAPAVDSRAVGSVNVALVPESLVAGRVLRKDGTPVSGAQVVMSVAREEERDGPGTFRMGGRRGFSRRVTMHEDEADPNAALDAARQSTETAADGSFELRGAAPGNWELSATHADFVDSPKQPLTLAAGEARENLELTLEPAGIVTGVVTEHDGTPAADVEVTVAAVVDRKPRSLTEDVEVQIGRMLQIDDGTGRRFARTDSDGTYKVAGLAAGDYDVALGGGPRRGRSFGGGGMMFAFNGSGGDGGDNRPTQTVKVVPGSEVRADFTRPRRGTVTGRVLAGGRAIPDQLVQLERAQAEGGFRIPGLGGGEEARTDDRGVFTFTDIEAGEYDLSTHVPGAALERKAHVKLQAGDARTADLVFGGSTLTGRVIDRASGAGAPGVTLTVVPVKSAEPEDEPAVSMSFSFVTVDGSGGGAPSGMNIQLGGGPAQTIRSDDKGEFQLLWVEPGKYTVQARGGGYMKGETSAFEVADGQNKDDLRVEVVRGAIVQGLVTSGQTGERLDSVPVRIEGGDASQMVVTQNGSYRFEGLEPGSYTVKVLGSGFGGDFGSGSELASEKVDLTTSEVRSLDLKTKS